MTQIFTDVWKNNLRESLLFVVKKEQGKTKSLKYFRRKLIEYIWFPLLINF